MSSDQSRLGRLPWEQAPISIPPSIGGATKATEVEMEPEERRHLRSDAVAHAVWLHGETDIEEYMRQEKIDAVLKTAEAFYDWVIADA